MTKYRLKKDTPEFKAGEVFEMIHNVDVGDVLTQNAFRQDVYAFEVDLIDNFDEWFDMVDDKQWITDTTLDVTTNSVHVEFADSLEAIDFLDFIRAVNIVSQDKGFMVPYKTSGNMVYGFGISRGWGGSIYAERDDHRIIAGQLYFDSEENAATSIETHFSEWSIIMNYGWSK